MLDHGDVRELALSTRLSRTVGIKVSVFLVRGTLIDSGFWRARHHLAEVLASHSVDRAIVTHWHEDHSGNLPLLVQHQVPTVVSDLTWARYPETQSLPFYRWAIWGAGPTAVLPPPASPGELEILPTPGHSEDHVSIWDPRSESAFGGDLFLGVKACTSHSYEDPYATLASIRRIAELRPKRFFDAHRGAIRDPVGALAAKGEWLARTIGEIERRIDLGDPDPIIRTQVLGREEAATWVSGAEMSKLNFVRAVRRTYSSR